MAVSRHGGSRSSWRRLPTSPWTEAKVDSTNPERAPLLIISGERDHTVPLDHRQRVVKEAEAKRVRDRGHGDGRPRPRAHHRRRMARGRRHRALVREEVHVSWPPYALDGCPRDA